MLTGASDAIPFIVFPYAKHLFSAVKSFLSIAVIVALLAACGENEERADGPGVPGRVVIKSKKKNAKETGGDDLVEDLFSLGAAVVESADEIGQGLLGLTEEEQKRIGLQFHNQLRKKHGILGQGAWLGRFRKLAAPFEKALSREDVDLQYYLVEAEEVNAFAHVGGYVYVNTGLLDIVSSDVELQFVLGHEIAHLEFGHCEQMVTYAARARGLGAALGGELGAGSGELISSLLYQTLSCSYSEDQELACDKWSYLVMRKAGISHEDCCAMSRKFLSRAGTAKTGVQRRGSPAGKVASELDHHFRTHPSARERLEALEQLK